MSVGQERNVIYYPIREDMVCRASRVRAETRRCGNTADREKNGVKIINGFK